MIWAALLACGPPETRPLIDASYLTVGLECDVAEAGPPEEYLYIADPSDDTIWVVNPRTCTTVVQIPVGHEPVFANASLSGRWVYVANHGDHTLSVIDSDVNRVARVVALDFAPSAMWFGGRRRYLWVQGEAEQAIYDTREQVLLPITPPPAPLAMTGSSPAVAVSPGAGGLEIREVSTGALLSVIDAKAEVVTYSPALDTVVGCEGKQVLEVDPRGGWVKRGAVLPGRCRRVRVEDCSRNALVVTSAGVTLLDGSTPVREVPVLAERGDWLDGVAALTEPSAGLVHLVAKEGEVHSVPLGAWSGVRQVRVSLDRRHLYVLTDEGLVIVDAKKRRVRGRVRLGPDPRAVIVAGPVGGTCC